MHGLLIHASASEAMRRRLSCWAKVFINEVMACTVHATNRLEFDLEPGCGNCKIKDSGMISDSVRNDIRYILHVGNI